MKVCKGCFLPIAECCSHKFVHVPNSCICDYGTWLCDDKLTRIPAVCKNYKSQNGGQCDTCGHEAGCHTKEKINK